MPHIHTEPGQHDLTASAFIIRQVEGVPHILFHLHKKHAKLLQPGGHVETSETPWQAIAHELEEETGYKLHDLEVLQPAGMLKSLPGIVMHPIPSTFNTHSINTDNGLHYHTDAAFTFIATDIPSSKPHEGESQDLRWLSLQDIEKLKGGEIYPDTVDLCRHAVEVTLRDWQPVSTSEFAV